MKYLSCYKYLAEDDQTNGGIGQGGGSYWTDVVGIKLQQAIANELGAALTLHKRLHGPQSFDGGDYEPPTGFDVAYLQLFERPTKRPAEFVWSVISDYIHMEAHLERWLEAAKPNLLISFQYPLDPPRMIPSCPQLGMLPDLVAQCERHGCWVVHLPWFNQTNFPVYNPNKKHSGMCTGKMSGTYPWRDKVYRYLQSLDRLDIVLSGNAQGSTFKLSDAEYRAALASTKYYFTGGIYDLQIPPKVFEVCNYGAALVVNDMPMLQDCGFIHGETCFVIHSLEEIPYLLASDLWELVGRAGQRMVHEKHSMAQRARDIANLIREGMGV